MSRENRGKRIVVYPIYFDRSATRSQGRRVPLKLAINNPSVDKIVEACSKLGLNPVVEHDKSHPRSYHLRGRVIVDKKGSKIKTLFIIANKLKEIEK